MDDERMERLARVLAEEERLLAALETLLRDEAAALVANDLPRLGRLELSKDGLLASFAGQEARRQGLQRGEDQALRVVADRCPEPMRGRLHGLRERMIEAAARVKLGMRRNQALLAQGAACVQVVLEALRYPQGRLELYGPAAGMVQDPATHVFELNL